MMNVLRVSVLSNDRDYAKWLHYHLNKDFDGEYHSFKNASEFLYELPNKPNIVLIDAALTDMNPFQLAKAIKDFHGQINVIMLLDEPLTTAQLKRYDHLIHTSIQKQDDEINDFGKALAMIREEQEALQLKLAIALKKRTEVLNNLRGSINDLVKEKKASSILNKLWETR